MESKLKFILCGFIAMARVSGVLQPSFHVMNKTGIMELCKLNVFIDAYGVFIGTIWLVMSASEDFIVIIELPCLLFSFNTLVHPSVASIIKQLLNINVDHKAKRLILMSARTGVQTLLKSTL